MFPLHGAFNTQAVTAAGSAQTDATEIGTRPPATIVVAGADATKGVKLPPASAGKVYFIKNNVAAVLKVYPATGDAINAIAANSAISMASLTSAAFVATSDTQWFTVPLLPS